MKKSSYYILFCLSVLFASCGEDRSQEYEAVIAPNKWIDEKMREVYLWYNDMPDPDNIKYLGNSTTFFRNLLSKKTQGNKSDSYSSIEVIDPYNNPTSDLSYGFNYVIRQSVVSSKVYYARIRYVLPNSPASEAGLKRGDWIAAVNDKPLTNSNAAELLSNSGATTFTMATVTYIEGNPAWTESEKIAITAPRVVENNPFLVEEVIEWKGKNIGYLLYNHFDSASENSPEEDTYFNQMMDVFKRFKAENLNEFILDLRYNSGGNSWENMENVQLLGSLLVPSSDFGKTFYSLNFSDKRESENQDLPFDETLAAGSNLELSKLYIITSKETAAASEVLINGLSPYMKVLTVGLTTVGNNILCEPYTDDRFPTITINPAVAIITNAQKETNYTGIKPNFEVDENNFYSDINPLGNINETIFQNILTHIESGIWPQKRTEGKKEFEVNETIEPAYIDHSE